MTGLTDEELMAQISKGDQKAFAEVFRRYGRPVLGYCVRLLGDRGAAEDVSQDVWLKVVQQSEHYEARGKLISWLLTIARNTCLNLMRSKKRFSDATRAAEDFLIDDPPSRTSLEELLIEQENRRALQHAVDSLPETQRVVLMMYMTEDMSYDEISKLTHNSVSSIKSLLFRARQSLERALIGGALEKVE